MILDKVTCTSYAYISLHHEVLDIQTFKCCGSGNYSPPSHESDKQRHKDSQMSTSIFRFFLGIPLPLFTMIGSLSKMFIQQNPHSAQAPKGPQINKRIKTVNKKGPNEVCIQHILPFVALSFHSLLGDFRLFPIVLPYVKIYWSNMDSLPTWKGPWCPVEPSWLAWPCGVARGMAPAPVSVHAGGCGHMAVDGCATVTSKMEMETSFPESMAFIFETLIYHDGFILTSVFCRCFAMIFLKRSFSHDGTTKTGSWKFDMVNL